MMSKSVELLRRQIKDRQKARILAMKPGRELDALVARYVMACHVLKEKLGFDGSEDYFYLVREHGKLLDEPEIERVPNYSTVLMSAEKILSKFSGWKIGKENDESGISACLSRSEAPGGAAFGCATIPEAICKAALIALVEENMIIDQLLSDL
jgi:hypothetical protein